jgi:DNA-binding Xre family transcriptional regulator
LSVSYKKLWKLLIDRDLKKGDLSRRSNVSGTSLAKMARGETANTDTLARICIALNCTLDDISEIINDKPKEAIRDDE